MMNGIKAIYAQFLNLIYPKRAVCLGCNDQLGCERDYLCEKCRTTLAEMSLGVTAPEKHSDLDATAFVYRYIGPAGSLVRHLKYSGVWDLAEFMGRDMARTAGFMRMEEPNVVCSVPMHARRKRRRGANHSELLGRVVAREMGLEYMEILKRTRNTPQQARLSAEKRRRNLDDAFTVTCQIRGKNILLVDDVYTTGTTAQNCARALRAAGARRIYFVAYALGTHRTGRNANGENKQR